MFKKLLIAIFVLVVFSRAEAQLTIKNNNKTITLQSGGIEYAILPNKDFTIATLKTIKKSGWKKLETNKIPISFNANSIWLKIPLRVITNYGNFDLVEIDNPHINFLRFWVVKNDSIQQQSELTGDNTAFSTRPLPTTTFVMPIQYHSEEYLVIVADKKFTKLDLPIRFYSTNYFLQNQFKSSLFCGLFIGILILLACINISMYMAAKEMIYLWYSIYLCLICCYVLINEGIFFKFLYPNLPILNDVVRPGSLILSSVPLFIYFNRLLDIKTYKPTLYKWNVRLILGYFFILIIAILSSFVGDNEIKGFWLTTSSIISPFVIIVFLVEAIYCYRVKIAYASFLLASFAGITVLIFIFILGQNELTPENIFTRYANYLSIIYESLVMLIALIWRYKKNKKESEDRLELSHQNQYKLYNKIAVWQEKEMQRVASILHDTVGANLGFLRLETDNMALTEDGRNKIAEHITRIGNEVRNMSHSFSPIILQNKGLYKSIDEMVSIIKQDSQIDLSFEWHVEKEKLSLQYEIIVYRIVQEILQNLLKHSKAKYAFLQIILEQNLVSIYLEDDGVGVDTLLNSNGVGLKSIENLVTILNGNYKVESSLESGFSISIEFNQNNHDKI